MRDFVDRLNAGERNPWLAYELCKRHRLTGLGLAEVLDYIGVDYEFRGEQLGLERWAREK